MKSTLKLLLLGVFAIFVMASCEKDDNDSKKIIVKMGAQANTTLGGFYSIENGIYTQDAASSKQDTIDFLCFYERIEPDKLNNICLSSPGVSTGIYTGTTSNYENWSPRRLTIFTEPATAITAIEFDQIPQNDEIIKSYYSTTSNGGKGYKKAKDLQVDNIWAFKTHDNIYGLIKVISVVQGAEGYVEFELKYKK